MIADFGRRFRRRVAPLSQPRGGDAGLAAYPRSVRQEVGPSATAAIEKRHRIEARVLGGFHVAVDGRTIGPADWGRVSAARLVKLLLVTPGHRLSREAAGEHLWPDAESEHQATNLRKALHFARRAMSAGDDESAILVADRTHVELCRAIDLHLDLDSLADASDRLARSSRASPNDDTEVLLTLGREELLPDDPYEDWLVAPRERLAARWTAVALAEARAAMSAGDIIATAPLVDALLARDPADEEAHRLAIQMLAAQGRHHAARRQFYACRRELAEAFGIEPSAETVAALATAEASAAVLSGSGARRAPRLVGRDAELARIDELVERIGPDRGGVLVIRGPAGIGKSRLLDEATTVLSAAGWRVLEARSADLDRGLAFGPLRWAFRSIAAEEVAAWPEPGSSAMALLLPALGIQPAIMFSQPGALASGVSAAIEQLTAEQPVVMAIDDGQWLDDGSAELLARIAGATVGRPLILVIALRTDEAMSEGVRRLLDGLGHLDGDDLELGPLGKADVAPLVTPHLGGAKLEPAVVDLLFDRSEGNPLFCLELARTIRDEGRIALRGGTWRLAGSSAADVPPTVVRLVRARCSGLARGTLDLLVLAAEFEEPVRFDHLVRASGMPPEIVIDALEHALSGGLVAEAPGGYRFAHPLFRAALRQDAPAARRPSVLLTVAGTLAGDLDPFDRAALAAAVAAGVDPVGVAQRALMAAEAGLVDARPLAVGFGLEAGIRQGGLFQRETALATLDRALAIWSGLPETERQRFHVSPAFVARGRLLLTQLRESEARESFRHGIETGHDAEQIGAAYADLSFVDYRHGDYGSSMATLREGLSRAEGDEVLGAIVLTEMGWLEFRLQRLEESLAHLREAEAVFRRTGSEVWLMRVLDSVWGPLESMGRGEESMAGLDQALAISERRRDAWWEERIRIHLGFRLVIAGTPAQARPHLERGLRLARMTGDSLGEAVGLWAVAEMEFAHGDLVAADANLATELEALASIGGNPRQDAIAHIFRTHIARLRGNVGAATRFEEQARIAAAKASRGDEAFERRIHAYLEAPRWTPMSM